MYSLKMENYTFWRRVITELSKHFKYICINITYNEALGFFKITR